MASQLFILPLSGSSTILTNEWNVGTAADIDEGVDFGDGAEVGNDISDGGTYYGRYGLDPLPTDIDWINSGSISIRFSYRVVGPQTNDRVLEQLTWKIDAASGDASLLGTVTQPLGATPISNTTSVKSGWFPMITSQLSQLSASAGRFASGSIIEFAVIETPNKPGDLNGIRIDAVEIIASYTPTSIILDGPLYRTMARVDGVLRSTILDIDGYL